MAQIFTFEDMFNTALYVPTYTARVQLSGVTYTTELLSKKYSKLRGVTYTAELRLGGVTDTAELDRKKLQKKLGDASYSA